MFGLLLLSALALDTSHSLQCISNCSIGKFPFSQPLRIPDGQCQRRIDASNCNVNLELNYHDRTYEVAFGNSLVSRDLIYIRSGSYVSYDISYQCSQGTDCVLSYIRNRLNEMIGRGFNATRIYREVAPFIVSPLRNVSVQCYDMNNKVITCLRDEVCSVDYDQRGKKARSRGCTVGFGPRVLVYDGGSYSSLDIECDRNLCNDDTTTAQIKTILFNNGLTDADGRRIIGAGARKETISRLLLTLALIFTVVSYC